MNFVFVTATKAVFDSINVSVDFYVSAKRQMIGGYSSSLGSLSATRCYPISLTAFLNGCCVGCKGNILKVKGGQQQA